MFEPLKRLLLVRTKLIPTEPLIWRMTYSGKGTYFRCLVTNWWTATDKYSTNIRIVLLYFFVPNHFYNEGYALNRSINTVGGGGGAEERSNFDRIRKNIPEYSATRWE